MSINNPDYENYQDQSYPAEFEIKDTTSIKSNTSTSYLNLLLSMVMVGQLRTSPPGVTILTSVSQTFRLE